MRFATILIMHGLFLQTALAQVPQCGLDRFSFRLDEFRTTTDPPSRVIWKAVPGEPTKVNYLSARAGYGVVYGVNNLRMSPGGMGSEWIFLGGPLLTTRGNLISDEKYPALFRVVEGEGVVYLAGRAEIRNSKTGAVLGRLGATQTLKSVLGCVKSQRTLTREAVSWALGWLPRSASENTAATAALLILLRDANRDVRRTAAESLSRVGTKEAIGPLTVISSNDPDEDVREVAVEALLFIGADQEAARDLTKAPARESR